MHQKFEILLPEERSSSRSASKWQLCRCTGQDSWSFSRWCAVWQFSLMSCISYFQNNEGNIALQLINKGTVDWKKHSQKSSLDCQVWTPIVNDLFHDENRTWFENIHQVNEKWCWSPEAKSCEIDHLTVVIGPLNKNLWQYQGMRHD